MLDRPRAATRVCFRRQQEWVCRLALAATVASAIGCGGSKPFVIAIVLDAAGIEGAELAAARINAHGGINGHPLELRTMRGAEKSARMSLTTAEHLSEDKTVLAVVGHTNSAASLSASQVYNTRHLVQISPTTTAPLYSQAGPYSFRLVPSDVHQGAFLADAAVASGHATRVAVAYVNSDYGRPLAGIVVQRLRSAGVAPVWETPFDAIDSTSGRLLVTSLVRAKPQVLIWIGRSADLLPIAREVHAALPGMAIVASDAFSRRLPSDESRHVFDGVRYVRFVDVARPDTVLQNLRAAYFRSHKTEISDQTLLAFDAVTLLGDALRASGPDRDAIKSWLDDVGNAGRAFTGVTGPVKFASVRERTPSYVMVGVAP